MKIDLGLEGIIIRKVTNGFVVLKPSDEKEGEYDIFVYEFIESEAQALLHLIQDHFFECLQTKHTGGLAIEIKAEGYA